MAAHDYANTRFSPLGRDHPGQPRQADAWHSPSAPACCAAMKRRPSSPTTRCSSSRPTRTSSTRSISRKPGAPVKWKFDPKPQRQRPGRRLLRRRQSRRRLRRRQDLLQHARRPTPSRSTPTTRQGALAHQARRHQQGRDHHHGAARGEGQSPGRQQRRRDGRARLADGARRQTRGKIAWRAYSTGPDSDVLIGAGFKPFYAQRSRQGPRHQTLAAATAGRSAAAPSGAGSPTIPNRPDLLRHRQSRPVEPEQRPGDNKWTSGIFAREPDTGRGRLVLPVRARTTCTTTTGSTRTSCVELPIGGQHAQGDRCIPTATATCTCSIAPAARCCPPALRLHHAPARGVDLKTGRLIYNPAKDPQAGTPVRDICPAAPGAKDWQPSAWSPRTSLLYMPHQNLCMDAETYETSYIAGTPYVGASVKHVSRPRRPPRRIHGLGPGRRERSCGPSRRTSRSGAARSPPPATSSSTARWTAGSRRSTPRPASCCGSSRSAPASSASRRPTAARTASSTSPFCRASAAGPAPSSPATSTRATAPPPPASSTSTKDLPKYTTKGGMLYVFALP